MPQDKKYTIDLDDSTTVEFNPDKLPAGFDTLSEADQKTVLIKIVNDSMGKEEPATAYDILIPLGFVIIFALVILFIARRIQRNPKIYDTIVKMDGKPNADYGKDWKVKK